VRRSHNERNREFPENLPLGLKRGSDFVLKGFVRSCSRPPRCHSEFNHFEILFCTLLGACIFFESRKSIQQNGSSSFFLFLLDGKSAAPGFTMIHRDQCRSLLIGTNISLFLNMSMFFFAVQDLTASAPSLDKVV
jgi:hypothetical protein